MQLDCKLAAQVEQIAWLKNRLESGVGGVAVVSYEELASAIAKAILVLEKEAKAIALERVALCDARNQEALVLGRVDVRLGQLQGVVVDSMETAQKKLTDEVAWKIDKMLTAVSATAERAITTSSITNALHTLITIVSGSPPPRPDTEEPATTENAKPGDAEYGKRAAGAKADNQQGPKRQRGPQAAATATASLTAAGGKGKRKAGEEGPATAGSQPARREVQPTVAAATEVKNTAIAPAHAATTTGKHGHIASAFAGPSAAAIEHKTEERGRGAEKLPPPPVYTIDEDEAEDELENRVSRWIGPVGNGGGQGSEAAVEIHSGGESADEQDGDTVGAPSGETGQGVIGSKWRGYGIRAPPRGGPGLGSEPHLGGKKRWLGHGELEDLQ
ncbi:unnamed protein product [Closterium sp. Naga37s-1]|nr:unnamed protein product [Closterium sp. Naga37s-1]